MGTTVFFLVIGIQEEWGFYKKSELTDYFFKKLSHNIDYVEG